MSHKLRGTIRRWFQFRLTTFLMFVAVVSLGLAWWSDRQRAAREVQKRDNLIAMLRMARNERTQDTIELPRPEPFANPSERVEFLDLDGLLDWVRQSDVHPDPNKLGIFLSRVRDEPSAVRTMLGLLRDASSNVRSRAAFALGQIGVSERDDVLALATVLGDNEPAVRLQVACALAKLGSKARDALPVLIERIDTFEPANLKYASFDRIERRKHVSYMEEMDRLEELVMWVEVIVCIDPNFDLGPSLARLLKHPSPWVRLEVADLIRQMGPGANGAFPAVALMLTDDESDCRKIAAETLAKIAPPQEGLAHLLTAFEREQDQDLRKVFATLANELDRRITSPAR